MFEKGGDEVSQEGLTMGGVSAQMAIFEMTTGHESEVIGQEMEYGKVREEER